MVFRKTGTTFSHHAERLVEQIFSENRRRLFQIMLPAMLAPYFSCLLSAQSDFGLPARCCLADKIASDFPASDFPQNLVLWRVLQKCSRCAASASALSLTSGMT
jgi:hypothetical protein